MSKRKKKEWQAVPIEQFHYDTGIPMTEEEVQGLLQFRKRGYYIKNKRVRLLMTAREKIKK